MIILPSFSLSINGLSVVMLLFIWWGATAWNSVAAKRVAEEFPDAIPWMAVGSNLLGGIGYIVLRLYCKHLILICVPQSTLRLTMIPLSFCHGVGVLASYMGLMGAQVSLVQAIKAIEPLLAMAFSINMSNEFPSRDAVIAALILSAGVIIVCVSDISYTWHALLWAVASSVFTQIRNQFMKRQQVLLHVEEKNAKISFEHFASSSVRHNNNANSVDKSTSSFSALSPPLGGLLMFVIVSAYALPMNAMMAFCFWLHGYMNGRDIVVTESSVMKSMAVASTMHFLYNSASFGMLALLAPSTHSVANTTKRAFVFACASIFLGENLSNRGILGLVLTMGGSILYALQCNQQYVTDLQTKMKISIGAIALCSTLPLLCLISRTSIIGAVGYYHVTPSKTQNCIYYYVQFCLRSSPIVENKNFSLAELDASVDHCVHAWDQYGKEVKINRNDHGGSDSMEFPFILLQRGGIKDRVDWSVFRLGKMKQVGECLENCEALSTKEQSLLQAVPKWWYSRDALPTVSRQYLTGGSYLPPFYQESEDKNFLSRGFSLPKGPSRFVETPINGSNFHVRVYQGEPNLGDCFNFYLVGLLSGRNIKNMPPVGPTVCAVGSILNPTCDVVWGSGKMFSRADTFDKARHIFATRGPDTWSFLSSFHPKVYGDPGLLASLIYPLSSLSASETADICVVPHYIDQDQPSVIDTLHKSKSGSFSYHIRVLNIRTCDLEPYLQHMRKCKRIVSSSLHGLIFGAAYGIPGIRIILSDNVAGEHFKFRDFYGGIGHSELYAYEELQGYASIPYEKIISRFHAENLTVPAMNMEDLWNSNPVHAETLGMSRAEHIKFSQEFIQNFEEEYPHEAYLSLEATTVDLNVKDHAQRY